MSALRANFNKYIAHIKISKKHMPRCNGQKMMSNRSTQRKRVQSRHKLILRMNLPLSNRK